MFTCSKERWNNVLWLPKRRLREIHLKQNCIRMFPNGDSIYLLLICSEWLPRQWLQRTQSHSQPMGQRTRKVCSENWRVKGRVSPDRICTMLLFFEFIFVCVYVQVPIRVRDDARFLGADATGICDPPELGARIWILCSSDRGVSTLNHWAIPASSPSIFSIIFLASSLAICPAPSAPLVTPQLSLQPLLLAFYLQILEKNFLWPSFLCMLSQAPYCSFNTYSYTLSYNTNEVSVFLLDVSGGHSQLQEARSTRRRPFSSSEPMMLH